MTTESFNNVVESREFIISYSQTHHKDVQHKRPPTETTEQGLQIVSIDQAAN